jgi:copper chaperone CopZ
MTDAIAIQNLKCSGCAASIVKALRAFPEVREVLVDFENTAVVIETDDVSQHSKYKAALTRAGYPPADEPNTMGHKVHSYISCAIGRMSTQEA